MNSEPRKKILICEDHTIIIDGMKLLFQDHPDFELSGCTTLGENLLELISKQQPDMLLLDLNLKTTDGFSLLEQVKKKYPAVKVIILTMYKDEFLIERAKKSGAQGYLLKNIGNEELLSALHKVLSGEFYLSKTLQAKVTSAAMFRDGFPNKMKLTKRELEIIAHLVKGKSADQISDELSISVLTFETHRKNIFRKLNINRTVDLILFAHENSLF